MRRSSRSEPRRRGRSRAALAALTILAAGFPLTGAAQSPSPSGLVHTIRFTPPAGHAFMTLAIDNADGRRVRNLLGMAPLREQATAPDGTIAVAWDGRDDDGRAVPAGRYRARGLTLPGLTATLDYAWYGPGDPAWVGYPTSGWGGDHTGPASLAAVPRELANTGGVHVIVGGAICEGGDGIYALDRTGRKRWGYRRSGAGATALAMDGSTLVAALWQHNSLVRLNAESGRIERWQRRAGTLQEAKLPAPAPSLAVGAGILAAILQIGDAAPFSYKLLIMDRESAEPRHEIPLDGPATLAADPDGIVHLSMTNGFFMLDETGAMLALDLPELASPGPACFDADGKLYIVDQGPRQQIHVYDRDLTLVRRIGTAGGQGTRLAYDREALHNVHALAVDPAGRLWMTEGLHPRRQAVWSSEGVLLQQFVGNTQYGASGCALHEQDPLWAVAYGTRYRVDPTQVQRYHPAAYLNSGPRPGSPFVLKREADSFLRGTLLRSSASGQAREYYVQPADLGYVLYLSRKGDYRPVAALMNPKPAGGGLPWWHPDDPEGTVRLWSDWNEDECIQADEWQRVPEFPLAGNGWCRPFGSWTLPMRDELGFYPNGHAILPARHTAAGTPIYEVAQAKPFADALTTADSLFVRAGTHLVGYRNYGWDRVFHGHHIFTDLAGRIIATFPFDAHSLHGSMQKGVPPPGRTAGEQFIAGVADIGGELGSVLAYQGNYGQAFLFTEDGLFLSTLFKDVRTPHRDWGATMTKGQDMTDITMHQEPFGGWFGRQDDGVVRYLFGRNECVVVQVHGLDAVHRFDAGWVTLP